MDRNRFWILCNDKWVTPRHRLHLHTWTALSKERCVRVDVNAPLNGSSPNQHPRELIDQIIVSGNRGETHRRTLWELTTRVGFSRNLILHFRLSTRPSRLRNCTYKERSVVFLRNLMRTNAANARLTNLMILWSRDKTKWILFTVISKRICWSSCFV